MGAEKVRQHDDQPQQPKGCHGNVQRPDDRGFWQAALRRADAQNGGSVLYIQRIYIDILFGVVLLVGAFAFLPEREPYESLVSGLFLFIVAGAVSAFTYAGLQDDKYKIWKYNRDNNPTPEAKRRLDQIGTGCTCAMLLCTAIYVSLSLYGGEWERNVWLFAAGGILCAIISVVLNPYKGEDD